MMPNSVKRFALYLVVVVAISELLLAVFLSYLGRSRPEFGKQLRGVWAVQAVTNYFGDRIKQKREAALNWEPLSTKPSPYYVADKDFGYATRPGRYVFTYRRRSPETDIFQVTTTIKPNGARYTGGFTRKQRNLYLLGDSFVFGEGVNDEQTFAYLLNQESSNYTVHLYANGGYSWTQALMNLRKLAPQIREHDLIVLGYADFYKVRHIAAPSRIREYGQPKPYYSSEPRHLRASLNGGALRFDSIPMFCVNNGNLCDQADPPAEMIDAVSAALLREMKKLTHARIVILHMYGKRDDPLFKLLPANMEIVHATEQDFPYLIRDNVMGFDGHPGPYWHYAIYSKLKEALH